MECNNALLVLLIALNSVFICMSQQVHGQVAEQDSLALLALYEATNGDQWTDNSQWLTALPVDEWKGVTVHEGRVSAIALDSNNLYGAIPIEIAHLTALESLSISNNDLKELPDLNALPRLKKLVVHENQFTFEDIEPNIDLPALEEFVYAPQQGGQFIADIRECVAESMRFSFEVGGSANEYQFFKGGTPITPQQQEPEYVIASLSLEDRGSYTAEATNAKVPGLTIHSGKWTLIVEPLPPKPTIVRNGDFLHCPTGAFSYRWKWNGAWIKEGPEAFVEIHAPGAYTVCIGKPEWCKLGESDPFDIVVSVNERKAALAIRLYPNPTNGTLYLDAQYSSPHLLRYDVLTPLGRVVRQFSAVIPESVHRHMIDLAGLPAGMYIVRIADKTGYRAYSIVKR